MGYLLVLQKTCIEHALLTVHMPMHRFILPIAERNAAEHSMPVIGAAPDHRTIATAP